METSRLDYIEYAALGVFAVLIVVVATLGIEHITDPPSGYRYGPCYRNETCDWGLRCIRDNKMTRCVGDDLVIGPVHHINIHQFYKSLTQ